MTTFDYPAHIDPPFLQYPEPLKLERKGDSNERDIGSSLEMYTPCRKVFNNAEYTHKYNTYSGEYFLTSRRIILEKEWIKYQHHTLGSQRNIKFRSDKTQLIPR